MTRRPPRHTFRPTLDQLSGRVLLTIFAPPPPMIPDFPMPPTDICPDGPLDGGSTGSDSYPTSPYEMVTPSSILY